MKVKAEHIKEAVADNNDFITWMTKMCEEQDDTGDVSEETLVRADEILLDIVDAALELRDNEDKWAFNDEHAISDYARG